MHFEVISAQVLFYYLHVSEAFDRHKKAITLTDNFILYEWAYVQLRLLLQYNIK